MASWQSALAAQAAKLWGFGSVKPPSMAAARELDPQVLKEAVQSVTAGQGRFSRVPLYACGAGAAAAPVAAAPLEDEEAEEVAFAADGPPVALQPQRLSDALLFEPPTAAGPRCAVVYCPSGRGMPVSVAEAVSLAKRLLPLNVAVLAIDPTVDRRAACRLRDIQAALELLRGADGAGGLGYDRVALWGRSAGAATALRFAVKVPALVAIVCDSPHCDLESLSPLAGSPSPLSVLEWLAATAPAACGGSGQGTLPLEAAAAGEAAAAKAQAELREELELPPAAAARRCFVPALFIHGRQDTVAPPGRTQALREAYAGEREPVLWVPGGSHDSRRPASTLAKAALFLLRQFCLDEQPDLREAVERLASAAASVQEALPVSPQLVATESEVRRLLASPNREDGRRGLFLAALAACPSHRGASFGQVSLPVRWTREEPLLQAAAMATLPRPESEVVAAWATDSSQGGGAVYFAVLSATLLSLTAVELGPSAGEDAQQGAFAGLCPRVRPLAIAEASLGHGLAPHPVELHMDPSGTVELTLGDARLTAAAVDAAQRDGCVLGVSLWRGAQAATEPDAPAPSLEFLPGVPVGRRPQIPRALRQPGATLPGGAQVLSPGGLRTLISASSFLTPQGSLSLTLTEATPSECSRRTACGRHSPAASPARRLSPDTSLVATAQDPSSSPSARPFSPRTCQPVSPPCSPTAAADDSLWVTAAEGEHFLGSLEKLGLGIEEEAATPAAQELLLGQAWTWAGPGPTAADDAEVPPHAATWGAPGDL